MVGASAACAAACRPPNEYDITCRVRGEVEELGDGDYVCTIDSERGDTGISASVGDHRVSHDNISVDPVLILWRPTITAVEHDGVVDLVWDAPAPPPADDWKTDYVLDFATGAVVLDGESAPRGVTFPAELFEDVEDIEIQIWAEHQSSGYQRWVDQDVPPVTFAHVPVVPVSRRAACTIELDDEVTEYEPGTCPLTDGWFGTEAEFDRVTVDLGSVLSIARVIPHTSDDSIVLVSVDGELWRSLPDPPAENPVRYVRVVDGYRATEISAFAP